MGRAQEQWLFSELAASSRANVTWQLLGQQVMFAPGSLPGAEAVSTDTWDGYRPARQRVIDAMTELKLPNVVVLTGDVHSSWAYDVAPNPWDGYDAATGRGTLAVEFVTPAVSSPNGFANDRGPERIASPPPQRGHTSSIWRAYTAATWSSMSRASARRPTGSSCRPSANAAAPRRSTKRS